MLSKVTTVKAILKDNSDCQIGVMVRLGLWLAGWVRVRVRWQIHSLIVDHFPNSA